MLKCFTIVASFSDGSGCNTPVWGESEENAVVRFKARFREGYVREIHQIFHSPELESRLLSTTGVEDALNKLVLLAQEIGHPNLDNINETSLGVKEKLSQLSWYLGQTIKPSGGRSID